MVAVNTEKCIGCEECLEVCPQGVFRMNGNLSEPYQAVECIFCEACLGVCTVGAITITPP